MEPINDKLWLSSIAGIERASAHQHDQINHVVGVCHDNREQDFTCTYDYYNMSDGAYDPFGDSSQKTFDKAVNSVVDALNNGETVLVHCQAGQSRSVAVAATALARYNNHYDVQRALDMIRIEREPVRVDNVESALLDKAETHVERVNRHSP